MLDDPLRQNRGCYEPVLPIVELRHSCGLPSTVRGRFIVDGRKVPDSIMNALRRAAEAGQPVGVA